MKCRRITGESAIFLMRAISLFTTVASFSLMLSEVISSLSDTELYPNLRVVKTKAMDKSKEMTARVTQENILKRMVVDRVSKYLRLIWSPPEHF
jgi:hypothetical protein